jgi:hypothetical protein
MVSQYQYDRPLSTSTLILAAKLAPLQSASGQPVRNQSTRIPNVAGNKRGQAVSVHADPPRRHRQTTLRPSVDGYLLTEKERSNKRKTGADERRDNV